MKGYTPILVLLLLIPFGAAELTLDTIQFDPAIITAGDTVDVVAQYHVEGSIADPDKYANPDWKFSVELRADDTLTQKYIIIEDETGDNLYGTLFPTGFYNKVFRIRVLPSAPTGTYEFKLVGEWYYKGSSTGDEQFIRFTMPVKKEGIIVDIASVTTDPVQVRPGDEFVTINAFIENSGEKDAKSVEITLELPEEIEASYADNNRVWIGQLLAGTGKQTEFIIDIDEQATSGTYDIIYKIAYRDVDNNQYQAQKTLPLRIKPKPEIEVISYEGTGEAGGKGTLTITVKNTGEEKGEAVDVRLLKDSAQPFTLDVRSEYLGELRPGEEGTVLFDVNVDREADLREHTFTVLIRAKGDSEEGDDTIYTFRREASIDINGKATNYLLYAGILLALLVLLGFIGKNVRRKKQ